MARFSHKALKIKVRVHVLKALYDLVGNIFISIKCSSQRSQLLDISLFFQCRTALTAIARKRLVSDTRDLQVLHALPRA
jgi:hypothetical protein